MFQYLIKLPVTTVFIMALLMLAVDMTGQGIVVSFPCQGYFSVGFLLLGLGIIASGGYTFKQANTTINPITPEKTTSLVTTGVYRLSRNPMYIGFLIWLMACAVYFGNVINLFLLPIYIALVNRCFILPEEKVLAKLFGEEFLQYKKRVRRWL